MIILIIAAALVLLYIIFTFLVYRFAFYSPVGNQNDDFDIPPVLLRHSDGEKIRRMISEMNEIPYEERSIISRDGLRLRGRYYPSGREDALLCLCFHGYRGTPSRDFSGGARLMMDLGCDVILPEERAHLKSEGKTITFGVKERYDVLDWLGYALETFGSDRKVILAGISMGAATVLMSAGMGLPENVKGIIADCPYTKPMDIIFSVARGMHLPDWFTGLFARSAASFFGHFDLESASAEDGIKASPVPVLLIHGEADDLVPCEMSARLHEAAPEKSELYTFPGAYHGGSFLADKERYEKVVTYFIEKVTE